MGGADLTIDFVNIDLSGRWSLYTWKGLPYNHEILYKQRRLTKFLFLVGSSFAQIYSKYD